MRLLYQFSAGDSFLHRADPRAKLVLVACLLVATFIVPYPWVMPLIPIALLWLLGRTPPWEYWAFLALMAPLIVAITLIQAVSGDAPHIDLGVLAISISGLETGFTVSLRLAAMGVAFIMFSATTDPFDWGMAMYRSGLPYRVAFMFAFAMRFFPLLQEELVVIRSALAARGADVFSAWRPILFLKGVGMSVIPLGLGALRRSQDIALAMELRGFGYAEQVGVVRTLYRDIRMKRRDWWIIGISAAGLAAAVSQAARAGTLPTPTSGQKVFLLVLLTLLVAVGLVIAKALGGIDRDGDIPA